ncbi:helix-turn-helix domain-containing protein [Sulfitobacter pontiacus]|uniref:helix-turn-helix domain-containing protein n=1 Tax=Sulfitobacter pontiacus TaxID=60137 RepID=UPI0030EC3C73
MRVLVDARKTVGVTQQELASRLQRPQSFVAKVERGERRLDVIEFAEWALALKLDARELLGPVVDEVSLDRPSIKAD